MRGTHTLLALAGFFSLALGDAVTFTLGNPNDYQVTGTNIAVPTGDTLEILGNGKEDYGVDVAISDEMKKKIQETIKNDCKDELTSECFVKIREIIEHQDTELQTRFAPLVPLAILGALMAVGVGWYLEKSEEKYQPFHVPPHVISTASSLATASEIVVIPTEGAKPITITASPIPTASATATATVTTYKDSADGHDKGDVAIIIPEDIARILDDYLGKDQTSSCPDGESFEKKKKARQLGGLSGSVCGAELTMMNNAIAGTMLTIMGTQVPPRIRGDAVRAMNQAIAFVRSHSGSLRMTADQAAKVAEFLYPLVWQKMVNGQAIKGTNVIPKDSIDTEHEDECDKDKKHTATNCNVGCEAAGRLVECSTKCSRATACTSTSGATTTTAFKPWTAIPYPLATATSKPRAECEDKPSDFGMQFFTDKIYGGFCDKVSKDKKSETTVDKDGKTLNKRMPPPTHDPAQFTLGYEPNKDGGECQLKCGEAFYQLSGSCGAQNNLYMGGKLDVGCGTYSFSISRPEEPEPEPEPELKLSERVCFEKWRHNDVPSYSEDSDWWEKILKNSCDEFGDDAKVTPDKMITAMPNGYFNNPFIWTGAVWMKGCKAEGDSQSLQQPLPNDSSVTCRSLLINNYLKCNNGGTGGHIDAGCVRYTFMPKGPTKEDDVGLETDMYGRDR